MEQAQAHEVSKKARVEELAAIAEAKKILTSMTGAASEHTYGFLQLEEQSTVKSAIRNRAALAGFEAVNLVRRVAQKQKSALLAQLATRMDAMLRNGDTIGDDVFAK